jgi:hypothetical protein
LPSSFLEIIELDNGDIVLQRVDGEGEPLVNIKFSEESKSYMPDARLEIARAMIQAGIETVARMNEESTAVVSFEEEEDSENRVLH